MSAVRPALRVVVPEFDTGLTGRRSATLVERFEEAERLWQTGDIEPALTLLKSCVEDDPEDVDLWKRLGWRLLQLEDWDAAATCFEAVLELAPRDVQGLIQLAAIETHRRRPAAAAAVYERLLPLRPTDARLTCNLSYLYEQAGELSDCERTAREAIVLAPRLPEAWNNLGIALREQHDLPTAQACFCKAATLRPGFALAEFNRATTGLMRGAYRSSWRGYERRLHFSEATIPQPPLPIWQGERLPHGMLLVYSDQGSGDVFQFARFLPAIRAQAQAPIRLQVPPEMTGLLRGIAGVDEVVDRDSTDSNATPRVSLGSLPYRLNLDLVDLPGATRYLTAPHELPSALDRLISVSRESNKLRIGLVWQGNPSQQRDFVRSCPLTALLPLAAQTNCDWFSLQLGEQGRGQLPAVQSLWPLVDLASHLTDWNMTAGVLARLDLLISVDTAVAHLAGALGRPVWTMLTHTPDWRYGLTASTTPWYPTMRLFRQPRRGDWASVVDQVLHALSVDGLAHQAGGSAITSSRPVPRT